VHGILVYGLNFTKSWHRLPLRNNPKQPVLVLLAQAHKTAIGVPIVGVDVIVNNTLPMFAGHFQTGKHHFAFSGGVNPLSINLKAVNRYAFVQCE
jgi:hypothetical protein